jgi:hypothetical protein
MLQSLFGFVKFVLSLSAVAFVALNVLGALAYLVIFKRDLLKRAARAAISAPSSLANRFLVGMGAANGRLPSSMLLPPDLSSGDRFAEEAPRASANASPRCGFVPRHFSGRNRGT